jgi:hypothetical protein
LTIATLATSQNCPKEHCECPHAHFIDLFTNKTVLLLFLCLFAVFRCLFSLVLLLLLLTVAAGFEVRLRRGQRWAEKSRLSSLGGGVFY